MFVNALAAAALLLNTGCTANSEPNNAALTAEQQTILDKAAEKKCIELLEAYKTNDYARLKNALPPSLARQFSEDISSNPATRQKTHWAKSKATNF